MKLIVKDLYNPNLQIISKTLFFLFDTNCSIGESILAAPVCAAGCQVPQMVPRYVGIFEGFHSASG